MTSSELFTVFPVFLCVDVSASMAGGSIEAVNKALPDIQNEMRSNPMVGEIARVGLMTFSDDSRVVIPLCDLADAHLPELMVEGGTNFAAAFRGMRQAIESGMTSLPKGTPVYRPVVFFMSDGAHQAREDWTDALHQLTDKSWKFAPEVVTFGFADAQQESMQKIATRFAFIAKNSDPVTQVREIMNAIIGSIRTTSTSLADPAKQEGLYLDAPTEHFTPLPAITI
ncbi:vWA domain-containing protein [Paractinoplanes lichenicola]|uniref:VWA domain-containing protein n=1 Tax=Paractinoplanes lichenicola TaxID=2802976 RepID=A0ABS1VU58_9ACTN|nr:VWA domain-containing protein [Actinoplanes lichenicola]MBL7258020.1 VWA domain-containing protein [Actinoplanes lichenicola]